MNDDDFKFPELPIESLTIRGPDGKDHPFQAVDIYDYGRVAVDDRYSNQQAKPRFNQEVVNLCRAKALEVGKLDEFLGAVTMYRPYVTREDALAMLALARVGVDPKGVETVFMMVTQAEKDEDAERIRRVQDSLDKMAGAMGVSRGAAAASVVSSLDRLYGPGPIAPHVKLDVQFAAGDDKAVPLEQGAPCPTNKTTEK